MSFPRCLAPILFAVVAVAAVACGTGPTPAPAVPTGLVLVDPPAASSSAGASGTPATPPVAVHHAAEELDPSLATKKAPETFSAHFVTTKGDFVIEVHRAWAPNGADRFYNLVSLGFYDDTRFFRAISGFMVQFGIPAEPAVASKWVEAHIQDDPPKQSNRRGFVTFAQTGMPNSRTTQIFINYGDNSQLDAANFTPFGRVVTGMNVVDSLYAEYGEGAPNGNGPSQGRVQAEGNAYLDQDFPKLDRILSVTLMMPVPTRQTP
jgi:peptidyl-prolyl cis-trans isomerase A (cyclophilin A)